MKKQVVTTAGRGMHNAVHMQGFVKALLQRIFALPQLLQIKGRNIDYNTLVGFVRIGYRLVDFSCPNKENVSGGERIGFAFDDIGSLSLEKKDYFVKIMIVKGYIFHRGILQPKNPEALMKIALFVICLYFVFRIISHNIIPFPFIIENFVFHISINLLYSIFCNANSIIFILCVKYACYNKARVERYGARK